MEPDVCCNEPLPHYSIFCLHLVKWTSSALEHPASDQIFVLLQCLTSSISFHFLLEPHFLSLTSPVSCRAVTLPLSVVLSPSVCPLTLTFLCPHLPFLSLSLFVSIHAPSTNPRQSEKDNSLVLCGETASKNREGYLSCSILKEYLRFP